MDMDSFYEFEMYGEEILEEIGPAIGVIAVVVLIVGLLAAVFGIAMYVMRSLALYTIAQRRGLRNPWLSWIPVGQEWIIGSLSDQYQYVTAGKVQSRRKILLGLGIAALVVNALNSGSSIASEIAFMTEDVTWREISSVMLPVGAAIGLLSTVVGIANLVFRHMSMYDLYRSCDPKNATTFLVLGIIFGFTEPFFLMACRKKDQGMPPRKAAAAATAYTTQTPPTREEQAAGQAAAAGEYVEVQAEPEFPTETEALPENPNLIPLLPLVEVDSGSDAVEPE